MLFHFLVTISFQQKKTQNSPWIFKDLMKIAMERANFESQTEVEERLRALLEDKLAEQQARNRDKRRPSNHAEEPDQKRRRQQPQVSKTYMST
jgi:hypothetical protein